MGTQVHRAGWLWGGCPFRGCGCYLGLDILDFMLVLLSKYNLCTLRKPVKIRRSVSKRFMNCGSHLGSELKPNQTEFPHCANGSLGEGAFPRSQEGLVGLPESIPGAAQVSLPFFPRDWSTPGVLSQLGVSRPQVWKCGYLSECGSPSEQAAYLSWFQYWCFFSSDFDIPWMLQLFESSFH